MIDFNVNAAERHRAGYTVPTATAPEGLQLVNDLLTNATVGRTPPALAKAVADRCGVDLEDLNGSAVGFDRQEQRLIRHKALEMVAYALGRAEAQQALARTTERTLAAFAGMLEYARSLSVNHTNVAFQQVQQQFVRGYEEAIAEAYVREFQPGVMRHLKLVSEMARRSGDPLGNAHDAVKEAQANVGSSDQPKEYLATIAFRAGMTATFEQLAEEALLDKVRDLATQMPNLPPATILQTARSTFRGQSAADPTSQEALQRVAWRPVSAAKVADAVADGRARAEPVEMAEPALAR